jgi:hypothetical protein
MGSSPLSASWKVTVNSRPPFVIKRSANRRERTTGKKRHGKYLAAHAALSQAYPRQMSDLSRLCE